MGASTEIPARIFAALARGFKQKSRAVQEDRERLAKAIYKFYAAEDFNDDDLDCYEELVVLGIAARCFHCDKGFTSWSKDEHGEGICDDA